MKVTDDLVLVSNTPIIYPEDFPNPKGLPPYDETSFSFLTAGTVNIEFDYGLGFGEVFEQSNKNVAYKTTNVRRVRMESIAFADQTNLLGGPIAFRHHMSPNELRDMEKKGWGDPENNATITIILFRRSRIVRLGTLCRWWLS